MQVPQNLIAALLSSVAHINSGSSGTHPHAIILPAHTEHVPIHLTHHHAIKPKQIKMPMMNQVSVPVPVPVPVTVTINHHHEHEHEHEHEQKRNGQPIYIIVPHKAPEQHKEQPHYILVQQPPSYNVPSGSRESHKEHAPRKQAKKEDVGPLIATPGPKEKPTEVDWEFGGFKHQCTLTTTRVAVDKQAKTHGFQLMITQSIKCEHQQEGEHQKTIKQDGK